MSNETPPALHRSRSQEGLDADPKPNHTLESIFLSNLTHEIEDINKRKNEPAKIVKTLFSQHEARQNIHRKSQFFQEEGFRQLSK